MRSPLVRRSRYDDLRHQVEVLKAHECTGATLESDAMWVLDSLKVGGSAKLTVKGTLMVRPVPDPWDLKGWWTIIKFVRDAYVPPAWWPTPVTVTPEDLVGALDPEVSP